MLVRALEYTFTIVAAALTHNQGNDVICVGLDELRESASVPWNSPRGRRKKAPKTARTKRGRKSKRYRK